MHVSAGKGLVNQFFMHIASLMFAKALGGELVLPPAVHRTTFNATASWHMAPVASLLDVNHITEYWREKGVVIHVVSELTIHLRVEEIID